MQEIKDLCRMILGQKLRAKASAELRHCRTIGRLREKLELSEDSDLKQIRPKVKWTLLVKENSARC